LYGGPGFSVIYASIAQDFADGQEHSLVELRPKLAEDLGLSTEDLAEKLPSGTQLRWQNRIAWAASYLRGAGCLDRIRPGVFKITARGREILSDNHAKITIKVLDRFPEFKTFRQGKSAVASTSANGSPNPTEADETRTPEEMLESGFQALQDSLANDLLDAVKKMAPEAFEQLVVKLLVAMGYGGCWRMLEGQLVKLAMRELTASSRKTSWDLIRSTFRLRSGHP